jgi:hypothetical protein
MRFFSTRFLGIFSLLVFLKMPKNRPFSERHPGNSTQKTANRNGPAKNRGWQRKMGEGPSGRRTDKTPQQPRMPIALFGPEDEALNPLASG